MTWVIRENQLGFSPIGQVDTEEKVPVGTIVRAEDPDLGAGEFIYLKGVASTVVGSVVTYDSASFATALGAANAVGNVAVAMAANVADTYGWYQITGKSAMKVLASFAADAAVYLTATAGSVDDAVVAGDRIHRALSLTAIDTPSTGLAYVDIERPHVDDTAD